MPRTRKILLIVFALVTALFLYMFFFKPDGGAPLLTTETSVLLQEDIKGREFLTILLGLNRIRLDEEIFSSPLFTALEDFSIILPDSEVAGRSNPFAPIGAKSE